jgi:hypothetical protein
MYVMLSAHIARHNDLALYHILLLLKGTNQKQINLEESNKSKNREREREKEREKALLFSQ